MIYNERRPILYVDDTVEQRYAMRRILETEHFEVLEAGTGKEALALLEQPVALAVIDVKLPDINGYDLTRTIKSKKPHVPVLQVSASFSNPDLRASGFSGGADAYIAQPVHPSELVAVIRHMLRTSEAEDSLRFLATIGPKITSSLSLERTIQDIQDAITPTFADQCLIYVRNFAEQTSNSWFGSLSDATDRRVAIQAASTSKQARLLNSRLLLAPLSEIDPGFGAVAFELNQGREYTASDLVLASDLASRFGMVLQNCILFTAEQSTRSALIQAEKIATAGRMSAAIAHEINNPLEAITNLLFIIEHQPEASTSIREFATSALAEVTRVAHITRQSLGFYRELRVPSTVDVSQTVSDTVDFFRKRLAGKNIAVHLDLQEDCLIPGVAGEIRQVISNLLLNAVEAIDGDGQVTITTERCKDQVVIAIKDTGPGIDPDLQTRIFEPFFTTKKGTGTGLGLWITRSIVEKHGGQIRLVSRVGEHHGSEFHILLPNTA